MTDAIALPRVAGGRWAFGERLRGLWRAHPWLCAGIVAGYLLRLVLMPAAGYGDLHAIAYALHLLAFDGSLQPYSIIHAIPEDLVPVPGLFDFFTYPPLTYLVLGGAMALLRPFYGEGFGPAVGLNFYDLMSMRPQIALWLFLYKLPLLAADIAILATFWKIGADAGQKLRLAALWALNPVAIITAYLFGQFDFLPALFILIGWTAAMRGRPGWGAAALGISAGFKVYSVLVIPVFAVIAGRSLRDRIRLGAIAAGVFVITLLPTAFDPMALPVMFGSNSVQQTTENGIRVGQMFEHDGILSLVFVGVAFLFLHAERAAAGRTDRLLAYLIAVLVLTYSLTFGHLQWFTSAVVLMVLEWEARPSSRLVQVLLYGCALVVAFSWQVGGIFDFFLPVWPDVNLGWPSLWNFLPEALTRSLVDAARSGLAGAALFWVYANVFRAGTPSLEAPARE